MFASGNLHAYLYIHGAVYIAQSHVIIINMRPVQL